MNKLLVFIAGIVFGSVLTGVIIYYEVFLVFEDNQTRVEESEIKLFDVQIKQLRAGNIDSVVAYFQNEIKIRQSNLIRRKESK